MTTLHCKFPAGRSTRRSDNENAVDPQPERGLLYLQEEDGLLHCSFEMLSVPCL